MKDKANSDQTLKIKAIEDGVKKSMKDVVAHLLKVEPLNKGYSNVSYAFHMGVYDGIRKLIRDESFCPFRDVVEAIERGVENGIQKNCLELFEKIESLTNQLDEVSTEIYKLRKDLAQKDENT